MFIQPVGKRFWVAKLWLKLLEIILYGSYRFSHTIFTSSVLHFRVFFSTNFHFLKNSEKNHRSLFPWIDPGSQPPSWSEKVGIFWNALENHCVEFCERRTNTCTVDVFLCYFLRWMIKAQQVVYKLQSILQVLLRDFQWFQPNGKFNAQLLDV